jgi:hypothetical protein
VKNEPAVTIGGLTAAVAALIAVALAFGVPLTDGQQAAILGAVAVVGPLVAAFLTRARVTPAGNVVAYIPKRAAGPGLRVLAGEASSAKTGTEIDVSV